MNRYLTVIFVLQLGAVSRVVASPDALVETRNTVTQWVQTRQLISQTRADWAADKDTLEQTLRLFERELQSLTKQMDKESTDRTQVDKEREEALAQQQELNAALEQLTETAGRLEKRVVSLSATFPPPLMEKVQPLLGRIPADPAATKAGPVERMQNLVGILNEADKFNAAVTVVSEVRKNPAGAEVQVETIYVGLAQAYFVDKAGTYAGVSFVPPPKEPTAPAAAITPNAVAQPA